MYCVKCGVELSDRADFCPLCHTPAWKPPLPAENADGLRTASAFPDYVRTPRRSVRPWIMLAVTVLWAAVMLLLILIDLKITRQIVWSGFAAGGMAVFYIAALLPCWFRHPNPVIFIPCAAAAVLCLLVYISTATGGDWFFSLALPVTSVGTLIAEAAVALTRYVRKGYLFIYGGTLMLLGLFTLLIEWRIDTAFPLPFVFWSFYAMVPCLLIGLFLIFLAVCRPLREMLKRTFFL